MNILKGGQGRTAEDIYNDGFSLGLTMGAAAGILFWILVVDMKLLQ